ncbi:hypothetical protein KSE_64695 [Kitasatospora setae KM-6054]|uniref:Uncharacterized protein n=1 Tax=Kitasatospora setae (strain ATCC 33774 / DSM 43861 / JCM 3304 / KCC A-0304 / NBRC 14216 / KM-6054) TaxID=452652 RepID=E4N245_KITSK|nr:hypothetical protein KSE_64695 [Kitasatospora setae KM-6054]
MTTTLDEETEAAELATAAVREPPRPCGSHRGGPETPAVPVVADGLSHPERITTETTDLPERSVRAAVTGPGRRRDTAGDGTRPSAPDQPRCGRPASVRSGIADAGHAGGSAPVAAASRAPAGIHTIVVQIRISV